MRKKVLTIFLVTIMAVFTTYPLQITLAKDAEQQNNKTPIKIEKKDGYIYEWYDGIPRQYQNQVTSEMKNVKDDKKQSVSSPPKNSLSTKSFSTMGGDFDNSDPAATGCANGAITAKSVVMKRATDNVVVGITELRYSPSCETAWARITVSALDILKDGMTSLHRSEGGKYVFKTKTFASPGTSNYTNQFNDSGTTSFAFSTIRDRNNQPILAQTDPY